MPCGRSPDMAISMRAMGDTTGIEWCSATWNPWMGCTKVSPGCAHCYMFREQRHYGHDPELVRRSKTKFTEPTKWASPRLIFTCSWSDWFHPTADAWRDEAWDVIRRTPQHTYQILTKRPERMGDHLPLDWADGYPNVWLGVSVENDRWVTRIPYLHAIPATIRFLSCEPLLGPLALGGMLDGIHWVIVGGESGPRARPMDIRWARTILADCRASGAAFFLKQLGGWPNKRGGGGAVLDGQRYTEMPSSLSVPAPG